MVAYTTRMPAGIPGDVNRAWQSTVEAQVITPSGTTGAPTAYGVPLAVDATAGNVGNMRTFAQGETTVHCYGLLARPYPTNSSQSALGTSLPPAAGACDVLRVGYMTVLLSGATAALKGGKVYIWTGAAGSGHVIGGFEAADPSTNGFALLGASFMGPADSLGNIEISIDCRNT